MKTVAIVLAAGMGKRMQSTVAKQYLLIHNKPILYYCLQTFQDSFVDEIVLVVGEGEEAYCKENIVERYQFHKVSKVVPGGRERYHSVFQGLQAVKDADYYFIHDSARPMITQDILERAMKCVRINKACVVGMPVKDTIKVASVDGSIEYTPNRDLVWSIQTPQVFEGELIRSAYRMLIEKEQDMIDQGIQITDDAMVVETIMKERVYLVEGNYQNIKITTPEDLVIAEQFLKENC